MDLLGRENRDLDIDIDIESGGTCSEEDSCSSRESSPAAKNQVKKKLFDKSYVKDEGEISVCVHLLNSDGVENLKLVTNHRVAGENTLGSAEKKEVKEKRKKTSNKKPPRPPRPPRGPSLDAADQKLIREITELAMLKRARNARMKALKKMKASKGTPSNNNIIAMIFTVLFFLVIIIQGITPKTRASMATFEGPSPQSLGGTEGPLISVHFKPTSSFSYVNGPADASQNLVKQIAGSDVREGSVRVSG